MKKPLGKTELTGLILLALIVVVITGCGLLLTECRSGKGPDPSVEPEIVVLDSTVSVVPAEQAVKGKTRKGKKNKASRKKKSAAKKAEIQRPDPFRDTIPVERP